MERRYLVVASGRLGYPETDGTIVVAELRIRGGTSKQARQFVREAASQFAWEVTRGFAWVVRSLDMGGFIALGTVSAAKGTDSETMDDAAVRLYSMRRLLTTSFRFEPVGGPD